MPARGASGSRTGIGPSPAAASSSFIARRRHLHAAPICYGARHMNTTAKALNGPSHAWKIAESLDLYQVEAWGKGYFSINAQGHVVIRPNQDATREIDLYDVVQGLKARDLHTPVVIRFSDILAHRLRHLAGACAT